MANLLESDSSKLFQNLLINDDQGGEDFPPGGFPFGNKPQQKSLHTVVIPKPGFCVKLKNAKSNEKVFINVCQAENVPPAKEITDEELLELLDKEDAPEFRIPMSLGEPHAELDRSGGGCTAYDVVIHPAFLVRVLTSDVMLGFLISVVMEGLEVKYDLTLDRQWKILKNKKFIGTLPEQNIRANPTPLIQDMNRESLGMKPLISEMSDSTSKTTEPAVPKAPAPPYTIIQEPPDGVPEYLVAEMHLPKVKSASSVTVDIGEDRILLQTRSNIYYLDIYLPYNIIQEDCAAQYNKNTKILTLTMPVASS